MYRPLDFNQFFDLISSPLEKALLQSSNIFLLGDFNCNLLIEGNQESDTNILNANTNKLRSIFEMFNMQNVIQEATRLTITSSTLIDLVVTTRKDLVSSSGVFPLGTSDHHFIYATIRIKKQKTATQDYQDKRL